MRFFSWHHIDNALMGAAVLTAAGFGIQDLRKRLLPPPPAPPAEAVPRYRYQVQLHDAAAMGDDARVAQLLRDGAEVDLVDERFGRSALSVAAEHGHTALVEEFARRAPNLVDSVDRHGMSALELAAWRGYAGTTAALLRFGAAANTVDSYGITALHKAAAHGHVDVVSVLVRHDPILARQRVAESFSTAGEYGTPLHVAAGKGHADVVRVLLEEGEAAVDAADHEACTALHHGAEVLAVVEVLLAHGADPRLLCHGQRPADMCGAHAHKARARLEQAVRGAGEGNKASTKAAPEPALPAASKKSLGWQDNAAALVAQNSPRQKT